MRNLNKHYAKHKPSKSYSYLVKGNSNSFETKRKSRKDRISKMNMKSFIPPDSQNKIRIVTKKSRPSKLQNQRS